MADGANLTRQQKQFADLILENPGHPAGDLYGVAYPKAAKSSRDAAAARLLRNVKVRAYLKARREDLQKKTEINQERVLRQYAAIAFLDPIDIFTDDGHLKQLSEIPEQARLAIASIEHEYRTEGRGDNAATVHVVKLKLHNKREALRDLATHLGMFKGQGENNPGDALQALAKLIKPTLGPPKLRKP